MKLRFLSLTALLLLQALFVLPSFGAVTQLDKKVLGHRFSFEDMAGVSFEGSSFDSHYNSKIAQSLEKFIESYEVESSIKAETIDAIKNLVPLFRAASVAMYGVAGFDEPKHRRFAASKHCLDFISQDDGTYSIPVIYRTLEDRTHYLSISVCGDYLSLNNRGFKVIPDETSGLNIYSIKGKKDLLESIRPGLMIADADAFEVLNNQFDKIGIIRMPRQAVGNCGWTSAKADFLAHLFFIFAYVQYEVDLDQLSYLHLQMVAREAKRVYYHWALFDRVQAYREYVNKLDGASDCLSVISAVKLHEHYTNTLSMSPNPSMEELHTVLPDEETLQSLRNQLGCFYSGISEEKRISKMINDALFYDIVNILDDFLLNYFNWGALPSDPSVLRNRKPFKGHNPIGLVSSCGHNSFHSLIYSGVVPKITAAYAMDENVSVAVLEELVKAGADASANNSAGKSLLEYVIERGVLPSEIRIFIMRGANVHAKCSGGQSLVSYAMDKYAFIDVLQALVENGADVNAKNSAGESLLEYVVSRAWYDSNVAAFIRAGADVHAKTSTGHSLVSYAMDKRVFVSVLEQLIKAGADANAVSSAGLSVLEYIEQRHPIDSRLLERLGRTM